MAAAVTAGVADAPAVAEASCVGGRAVLAGATTGAAATAEVEGAEEHPLMIGHDIHGVLLPTGGSVGVLEQEAAAVVVL